MKKIGDNIGNIKVAVVHDWLVTNGGAEKVLKEILEIFPASDIFSIVNFLNAQDAQEILGDREVKTSFIQNLPYAKRNFRNYLPLFLKAIESFDLKDYDLIISSSWAFAKGVKKSWNQKHISYCHTPIRYAWDLYSEYTSNLPQPKKLIVELTLKYIRWWDIKSLNRVDHFIANSNFVKERIKRIYKRDSKVIYPPVDTNSFSLHKEKEEFYLTASRLVPYKKTRLIVEAFNEMPSKRLIVIGDGEEFEAIKAIAKDNISLLGYLERDRVIHYMQRAKGFVYGAVEDFGIVLAEALSCGTPVIALNKGGAVEIVESDRVGILFDRQSKDDIIDAIREFEKMEFNPEYISRYAQKFSISNFHKSLKSYIKEVI